MDVIKIGLIGECGVGKTTLAEFLQTPVEEWIASDKMERYQPYVPTVGCNIQVLSMPYPSAGSNGVGEASPSREIIVELWDVGGNPRFASSRSMFYSNCDGFIFVWDASSEATYHALDQWLNEVIRSRAARSTGLNSSPMPLLQRLEKGEKPPTFSAPSTPLRLRVSSGTGVEIHSLLSTNALPPSHAYAHPNSSFGSPLHPPSGAHTQQYHFSPLRARVRTGAASTYVSGGGLTSSSNTSSSRSSNATTSSSSSSLRDLEFGLLAPGDETEVLDIPLIIVGNKADKLGATEYAELAEACAQHTFVSTRSAESRMCDAGDIRAFFQRCYENKRKTEKTESDAR